jgi:hypothetical protein
MPRTCLICQRSDRASIDAALVAGTPIRSIALQIGVSHMAVQRHKAEHLPTQLAQAHAAEEVAQADVLLSQVRTLHAKSCTILERAEAEGDLRTALMGIREARSCLELLAKLLGELSDAPQVNVLVMPEWLAVRSTLLAALAPYGEARAAVASALLALEGVSDVA